MWSILHNKVNIILVNIILTLLCKIDHTHTKLIYNYNAIPMQFVFVDCNRNLMSNMDENLDNTVLAIFFMGNKQNSLQK